MRVSFVSQLCWQHSHGLTERSICHRAAQGLISQAGLLVCNQKAESLECLCTDPAWKSPENIPVLLSFPALSWGGEYPHVVLWCCISAAPAQQNRSFPDWGCRMEWASGYGSHSLCVARSCYSTAGYCHQALPGHLCMFVRTVAMAPGLCSVHRE